MMKKPTGHPPTTELTPAQRRTYDAIKSIIERTHVPPTMRELGESLGISAATANEHVCHLEWKGWVSQGDRKLRSLRLLPRPGGTMSHVTSIPVIGRVAAGYPILAEENLSGHVMIDSAMARRGEFFALEVFGESMRDADIKPGDLAIVRRQSNAENGEIVVAMLDGEATVKTFSRRGRQIRLLPANREFRPINVTEASFEVLGKVVAINRPVRP